MNAISSTLFPVLAVILGAILAAWRRPGEGLVSGLQHLAAGVVFAAAATEILPQVVHSGSPATTLAGGGLAVILMLGLKGAQGEGKGRARCWLPSAWTFSSTGWCWGWPFWRELGRGFC